MPIENCQSCIGNQACEGQVAAECLPVRAFGNVSSNSVQVATIGLNPARNEFFDYYRVPIEPPSQRLAMLIDYGTPNRVDLQDIDIADAKCRREGYFKDMNRGWHPHFEKLESLISRVQPAWSYFSGRVVHLDLVACATEKRWGHLTDNCKSALLTNCREHFLESLSQLPNGTLLLLDGTTVVREMRQLGLSFEQEGGDQLINIRGNRGCIGKLTFGDKVFPFRGWSTPVGQLTLPWRYDLAFWICGTLCPSLPFFPTRK